MSTNTDSDGKMSVIARILDSDIWYSFTRSKVTMIAAFVTFLIFASALFAPIISPHNPFDLASLSLMDSLLPPAWNADGDPNYLLGTDDQGRDVLSTILYGSRISIAVGLVSVAFAAVLGITLGLVAGYMGGRVDAIIMRVADVQLSFPAILIALLIDGTVNALVGGMDRERKRLFFSSSST